MDEDFAQRITESQQRLYGYIHSLTGNSSNSWDILQETNIVLWRKKAEFQPGSSFDSWSFTIARFQVMAYVRDRKRESLSLLTPELLEAFGAEVEHEAGHYDERLAALKVCRSKLPEKSRQLITLYYDRGLSMKEVSGVLASSITSIKQALFRTRRALQDCIEATLVPKGP